MAWRPTEYLIEGELDNTEPGKVTGWMRFAGLSRRVTFNLTGNFHRDIRGAKVHFTNEPTADLAEAREYMRGFALRQTGNVGDMTAGDPPADYVKGSVYLEWYGNESGRVVIELNREQLQIIGRPIPACESDPISREEQRANMMGFLASLSKAMNVPAVVTDSRGILVSDPVFTHWVVVDNETVGEAHSVEDHGDGQSFAFVRLFNVPECAEFGLIETHRLRRKPR